MFHPVRSLAVLAAIMRKLALRARSQVYDLDIALRVGRVVLRFGSVGSWLAFRVCSYEAPRAILLDHRFVDDGDQRLDLHDDIAITDPGRALVRYL